MKLQFNVQMSRQYLFDFFLQHTYRTLRGKLSLLAGLAMIPLCVLTWNRVGRMFSVCYIFFAIFFLLLMPGKLWIKADQGFKRTPVYRKPFTYKVDSTGITTIQNAQTGHLKWAQVEKVIDSQLCLYVYINKADAYVWPKAAVGKNYPKLMELLKQPLCNPLALHEQVITLWTATHKKMVHVDKKNVKQYQKDLLAYFDNVYPEIGKEIEETKVLSDELGEKILQVADEFRDRAATK